MKLIVVPPDTSTHLLRALEAAGVHPQDVGGFQIMATRFCPPDKCFILQARPLELLKPMPAIEWNTDPAFLDDALTFCIDYESFVVQRSYFLHPPFWKRWYRSLRRWWRWALADFKATYRYMRWGE